MNTPQTLLHTRMEASLQFDLLDATIYQIKYIEVSDWLYQTKTHITHIVDQPFSRVMPRNCIAFDMSVCVSVNPELVSLEITTCMLILINHSRADSC